MQFHGNWTDRRQIGSILRIYHYQYHVKKLISYDSIQKEETKTKYQSINRYRNWFFKEEKRIKEPTLIAFPNANLLLIKEMPLYLSLSLSRYVEKSAWIRDREQCVHLLSLSLYALHSIKIVTVIKCSQETRRYNSRCVRNIYWLMTEWPWQ